MYVGDNEILKPDLETLNTFAIEIMLVASGSI